MPEYTKVSDGFKKALGATASSKNLVDTRSLLLKEGTKIPISGYTGHRMGYRAQNFYGKSFRDCTIQSKII